MSDPRRQQAGGEPNGGEPEAPGPYARPDASMTLITTMLERPLDPGYQEAADRRTASGQSGSTSTRTVIVVLMAILTGFLFAVAASSLRPKPTAAAAVKSELVSRIETRQNDSTAQEAGIVALTKQVRDLEEVALAQAGGADLTPAIKALEQQAGLTALTGPGITVTVDDAPAAITDAQAGTRPSGGFGPGRVSSADLQIVVNGVWATGAEAVSVNGHRLTGASAIRFAGQAIIVDFRPVTRPYVVTALGDPATMQTRFEASFAGLYLAQLTKEFGIPSTIAAVDALGLPGAADDRLFVAQPLDAVPGNAGAPPGSLSSQVSPSGSGGPTTTPTGSESTP